MQPFSADQFGGLDLRSDPEEVGLSMAVDILNVSLSRNGRITTRDGYSSLYAGPAGVTNIFPLSTETVLASFDANSIKAVALFSGTATATASIASSVSSIATAGGSGGFYYTDGSSAQVKKYLAGAFSSPAGLANIKGLFLATFPLEDRLVVADAVNTGRVIFSEPGTPEVFNYDTVPTPDVGDYVDLEPGDGEQITGLAVYGTQLFVFKKTKFFVFYGNSIDADGNTRFNYRMVNTGVGCWQTSSNENRVLTAVHTSGVYFVAQDGIYRTIGGEPVRVSDPISPLFKGANIPIPPSFLLDTTPAIIWGFLGVAADRLYACNTGGSGTYVLDLTTGGWSAYDWGASAVFEGARLASGLDTNGYRGAAVIGIAGALHLSNQSKTTDNGSAISWRWLSGAYNLSDPGRAAITLESRVWGTGTATLKVANDHGSVDAGSALTLGTSPATADAWQQIDREGVWWQHQFSGSGQATINKLVHYMSFVKPAGVQ